MPGWGALGSGAPGLAMLALGEAPGKVLAWPGLLPAPVDVAQAELAALASALGQAAPAPAALAVPAWVGVASAGMA